MIYLNKILFISEKTIFTEIINYYKSTKIKELIGFEVFESVQKEEKIIIVNMNDNTKYAEAFDYISSNYDVFKIINLDFATSLDNEDLAQGDIIIPNTIIKKGEDPIFIDYAIGANYDLKNFGLILNGICETDINIEKDNTEGIDISDTTAYNFINLCKKSNYLEKSIVIRGIFKENKKNVAKNLLQVLGLVL